MKSSPAMSSKQWYIKGRPPILIWLQQRPEGEWCNLDLLVWDMEVVKSSRNNAAADI